MRKLEKIQIIKNVGSSWLSLAVNVLVGIFLSPFILHKLGDAAFGIWVLVFSITGYYGIFDLGIRSSIVRYVSKFAATQETENIEKVVSTTLFSYTCIGALTMLLTLVFCVYLDRIFRIPPDFHATARWLLLIVGGSVAIGFPLGVFGGTLEGLQKFYILNWTNVVTSLLRATLIVFFLRRGYGLLTVALITAALPLFGALIRAAFVLYLLRMPMRLRSVDWAFFRQMASYSSITFIIIVASRLRFKTDELVIGTMLSAVAITYFNIGARIVDYATEVVTCLAQVFVPMSSHSDATQNIGRQRKIFVAGNRACAFVIFPICATLIILGKSVIEVWMGRKYIATSYPVLVVMIIPFTLMLAQSASGRVLFGMGKHGTWATVTLLEGIANLILSILLVRPYGIVGDALGTAIPLSLTSLFFLPRHVCNLLGIRLRTFIREAYLLPLLLSIPLVAVLLATQRWFVPHNYWQLGAALLAAGTVYGICLLLAFVGNHALHIGDLSSKLELPGPDVAGVTPVVENYRQDL